MIIISFVVLELLNSWNNVQWTEWEPDHLWTQSDRLKEILSTDMKVNGNLSKCYHDFQNRVGVSPFVKKYQAEFLKQGYNIAKNVEQWENGLPTG